MAEHFRLRTVFFCFVEKTDTSQDLTNSRTDLKKRLMIFFLDKIRYLVRCEINFDMLNIFLTTAFQKGCIRQYTAFHYRYSIIYQKLFKGFLPVTILAMEPTWEHQADPGDRLCQAPLAVAASNPHLQIGFQLFFRFSGNTEFILSHLDPHFLARPPD